MPHTELTGERKAWPSVTQISGLASGGEWLGMYYAKHSLKKAKLLLKMLKLAEEDIALDADLLKASGLNTLEFWADAEALKDRAREFGVKKHDILETVVPQLMAGLSYPPGDPYVDAMLNWATTNGIVFTASEQKVVSEEHKFHGSFDATALKDGKPCLIDWKFTTRLRQSAVLQMAGYDIALGGPARAGYLIRFHEAAQTHDRDWLKEIKAGKTCQLAGSKVVLEEHYIPDLGLYHSLFLGLRKLWDFLKSYPL